MVLCWALWPVTSLSLLGPDGSLYRGSRTLHWLDRLWYLNSLSIISALLFYCFKRCLMDFSDYMLVWLTCPTGTDGSWGHISAEQQLQKIPELQVKSSFGKPKLGYRHWAPAQARPRRCNMWDGIKVELKHVRPKASLKGNCKELHKSAWKIWAPQCLISSNGIMWMACFNLMQLCQGIPQGKWDYLKGANGNGLSRII